MTDPPEKSKLAFGPEYYPWQDKANYSYGHCRDNNAYILESLKTDPFFFINNTFMRVLNSCSLVIVD